MAPLNPAAPTFQPKTKSSAPIAVPSSPGSGEESYGLPDDPWALSNMTEVNGWAGRPAAGARSLSPSALPPGFCLGRVAACWRLCGPSGRLGPSRSGGGRLAFSPNASRALLFEGRRRGPRRSFAVPSARFHASGGAPGGGCGPGGGWQRAAETTWLQGHLPFWLPALPPADRDVHCAPDRPLGALRSREPPPGARPTAIAAAAPPLRRPAHLLGHRPTRPACCLPCCPPCCR